MTETPHKHKGTHGIPADYIGVQEVCNMFGKSRRTIYQMIAKNEFAVTS
jgi:predicted DNA-binding transcriptional regulator AlpA